MKVYQLGEVKSILTRPSRYWPQKHRWATVVLFFVSLLASLVYLRLGLARVFYPYVLDLVEEDMLMQAWRVALGQPVFVPPNAEFVPQVYMPLFTWLGGQLLRLVGFAFWPLRLLSFLSTIGTAVLLFYVGQRESSHKTAAFAGTALFLAGYRLVGGWHDLARVDALFTFLSLAGLTVLVYGRQNQGSRQRVKDTTRYSKKAVVLGAVLLGLAFLAKQNGLFLSVVAGIFLFLSTFSLAKGNVWPALRDSSKALLIFSLSLLLVAGPPILFWQVSSEGWFRYYLVTIAYASPLDFSRLRNIFLWELGAGMGVLAGLVLLLVGQQLIIFFGKIKSSDWPTAAFYLPTFISRNPWLLFVGAAVFISVAGRTTVGGNLNNMMIGYAFLCLAPALSWNLPGRDSGAPGIRPGGKLRAADKSAGFNVFCWTWLVAIAIQFGLVTFPLNRGLPQDYWPSAEMRAAGDALQDRVAQEPGDVWLLLNPSYAVRAGKRPYVHLQSLWHARRRGAQPLPSDLVELIENQHFVQIISAESDFFEKEPAFVSLLQTYYEVSETLSPGQAPPTLSGPVVRPQTVYVPRR